MAHSIKIIIKSEKGKELYTAQVKSLKCCFFSAVEQTYTTRFKDKIKNYINSFEQRGYKFKGIYNYNGEKLFKSFEQWTSNQATHSTQLKG